MLDNLKAQSPDALLALIKLFAADERSDKIDLGVGVYRTGQGDTPVFSAIKGAEARLLETQDTKGYLGPEGDTGFVEALKPYLLGEQFEHADRIGGMQTPGGTGAVRLALAIAQAAGVNAVHLGTPSWPNHAQILDDVGLTTKPFDHANADGRADVDAVLAAIAAAGDAGDAAVLLHGCCHNPTGIDYADEEWDRIAAAFAHSGALPIIDVAYQGLGRGMEADAYGVRAVLAAVPEALVAYSCDKNFGLYRDRVGALYFMGGNAETVERIASNANALARASWSMPPDHGAAAVRLVLADEQLTAQWQDELDTMRERMNSVRASLAEAGTAGSIDLRPLGWQNGMFSILPLNTDQIQALRDEHGVYMAGSGRINVAGLHGGNIAKFVEAVAAVSS